MRSNGLESCPRCGSNNVKYFDILFYILTGLVAIIIGFFFKSYSLISFSLIFFGAYFLLSIPFIWSKRKCEDCNNIWWHLFF